jgi:hypothetical protein
VEVNHNGNVALYVREGTVPLRGMSGDNNGVVESLQTATFGHCGDSVTIRNNKKGQNLDCLVCATALCSQWRQSTKLRCNEAQLLSFKRILVLKIGLVIATALDTFTKVVGLPPTRNPSMSFNGARNALNYPSNSHWMSPLCSVSAWRTHPAALRPHLLVPTCHLAFHPTRKNEFPDSRSAQSIHAS